MLQKINYRKLGARIKELRMSAGLTQDNLAEMVGCNTSHISNIENSHTKASLNVLRTIANSLDTSIDFLLSDQYSNESSALDNEILRLVSTLPIDKKNQVLRVVKAL